MEQEHYREYSIEHREYYMDVPSTNKSFNGCLHLSRMSKRTIGQHEKICFESLH